MGFRQITILSKDIGCDCRLQWRIKHILWLGFCSNIKSCCLYSPYNADGCSIYVEHKLSHRYAPIFSLQLQWLIPDIPLKKTRKQWKPFTMRCRSVQWTGSVTRRTWRCGPSFPISSLWVHILTSHVRHIDPKQNLR